MRFMCEKSHCIAARKKPSQALAMCQHPPLGGATSQGGLITLTHIYPDPAEERGPPRPGRGGAFDAFQSATRVRAMPPPRAMAAAFTPARRVRGRRACGRHGESRGEGPRNHPQTGPWR
jgi:hypothetical protein